MSVTAAAVPQQGVKLRGGQVMKRAGEDLRITERLALVREVIVPHRLAPCRRVARALRTNGSWLFRSAVQERRPPGTPGPSRGPPPARTTWPWNRRGDRRGG